MRAAALFLCALPSLAQERLPVDESATAFACTLEKALLGKKCTYEGEAGPSSAGENSRAALDAAARACESAAGSAELRKACLDEAAQAAHSAACGGKSRLVDDEGHATRDAALCVESLREVIARAERRTALSESCCACLARSGCGVPRNQCRDELADLVPGGALRKCLSRASCSDSCAMEFAGEQEQEKEPPPPRKRVPEKI